eukprot:scaffold84000_cov19-Phaeocystis_antarctica.AAC.1
MRASRRSSCASRRSRVPMRWWVSLCSSWRCWLAALPLREEEAVGVRVRARARVRVRVRVATNRSRVRAAAASHRQRSCRWRAPGAASHRNRRPSGRVAAIR